MTLNVELSPEEEAQLLAEAQAKGVSPDMLVHEAVKQLLSVAGARQKKPTRSSYGVFAKYGTAPSAEEIDENRREMFQNFARDDDEW